jgi:hypothetical protein
VAGALGIGNETASAIFSRSMIRRGDVWLFLALAAQLAIGAAGSSGWSSCAGA